MEFEERMNILKTEIATRLEPYVDRLEVATKEGTACAFTFGFGHANGNEYVLLARREDMFELFGRKWCWQYEATATQLASFRVHSVHPVELEEALLNYIIRYGADGNNDT